MVGVTLCLPAPHLNDSVDKKVFCGMCYVQRKIENAGHSFFDCYDSLRRRTSGNEQSTSPEPQSCNETAASCSSKQAGQKEKPGKASSELARLKRLVDGPNLYAVLQVDPSCNTEVIKKAYRRLALEFHPDKQKSREKGGSQSNDSKNKKSDSSTIEKSGSPSASLASNTSQPLSVTPWADEFKKYTQEEMFLLIQDAYEALIDPVFRRQYDSGLPFDESLPSASDVDSTDPQSFFKVFSPVFAANARWSSKKPVPDLGCLSSSAKEVNRFYQFWLHFDTTRDFATKDEYDTSEAECREERRWMERQNQKIRRKYVKEEKGRILKLTTLAQSLDPRVIQEREAEDLRRKELKEQKKRSAEAKREAQLAEEQQKREAEEARAQAEALAEREKIEQRQVAKAAIKSSRQSLRQLCEPAVSLNLLCPDLLQRTCLSLSLEDLKELGQRCAVADGPQQVAHAFTRYAIQRGLTTQEEAGGDTAGTTTADSTESAQEYLSPDSEQSSASVWTDEDIAALLLTLEKYPAGTPRRWQSIARALNAKPSKCVIEKAKELVANHKKLSTQNTSTFETLDSSSSSSLTLTSHVSGVEPGCVYIPHECC